MKSPIKPSRLAAVALTAVLGLGFFAQDMGTRNALWLVVNELCVPGELQKHDPAPCLRVDLSQGAERGYSVLPDIFGGRQVLVVPTTKVSGIENPSLMAPNAPNYFADAWDSRSFIEHGLSKPLARDTIGMAVNSKMSRSQDQLHIHVECIRPSVQKTLQARMPAIGEKWAPLEADLGGQRYDAMWVPGEQLSRSPFQLLAKDIPGAAQDMVDRTLVVVGASRPDGKPGFVLLEDAVKQGDRAHGEELLDPGCRVANAIRSGTLQ
jgi:CDP-diacylglycerol pyrophosphatase